MEADHNQILIFLRKLQEGVAEGAVDMVEGVGDCDVVGALQLPALSVVMAAVGAHKLLSHDGRSYLCPELVVAAAAVGNCVICCSLPERVYLWLEEEEEEEEEKILLFLPSVYCCTHQVHQAIRE